MKIDLNSDLGEGFGPYAIADDEAILDIITSANIACGYHAGDPVVMDRTIGFAHERGVDIGAHVGYPDRMGFGRRHIDMSLNELEKHVLYQLGALDALCRPHGARMTHMNPHGALGNLACADRAVAEALVRATSAFDPDLAYLVLSGTALEKAAKEAGRRTINLFLADRAYRIDGQLASRSLPGAVIKDRERVIDRILKVLGTGEIEAIEGGVFRVDVQSILLHSDTPGALDLARAVKTAVVEAGAAVTPLGVITDPAGAGT